jgi:Putative Ig domain
MSLMFWQRRQARAVSHPAESLARRRKRQQSMRLRVQLGAERLEDRLAPSATVTLPGSGFSGQQGGTVASFPISINQLQDNQTPNHVGLAGATLAITYPTGVFSFPLGGNQATANVALGSVPLSDTAAPGGAADWTLTANAPADGQLNITLTANAGDTITTNNPSTGGSLVLINFPISASYNPVSTTTEPITLVMANGSVQTAINGSNGTYVLSPTPPIAGAITVTPVLSISPPTLPADTVNTGYNQTVKASGGAGVVSFSAAGSLPPGVTLSSAGVLSGAPSLTGNFSFTVTATTTATGAFASLDDPSATAGSTIGAGASGNNVVGYYNDAAGTHGFLYNGTTYSTLDNPSAKGGASTFALGVSGSSVVGYFSDSSGRIHGFLYNGSSYTQLDVPAAGSGNTFATGISGSNVVGYYTNAGATHGFLYNGTTYTTLDDPAASAGTTTVMGISGSNIVGSFNDANGTHGFLYNGSTYTTLDDPSANLGSTFATGISGVNIVGYYNDGIGTHGFLYNGSVYSTLDDPSASPGNTYAYGVSGSNISGTYLDANGTHGYFYNASGTGATGSRNYSMTVNSPVVMPTSTLPNGSAGTPYSQTISASGGTGALTFSSTGTLPPGLTLSSAGVLAGTPSTPGNYSFRIFATDNVGASASQPFTVTIGLTTATQLSITAPSGATAGTPFNITVTAQDGSNHTAVGFNGTVTLSSSGGDIAPTSVTLTNGTATLPVTLTVAANETITASFTGLTSGMASIVVGYGAFSKYTVTTLVGAPTATAGNSFLVAVQAADQFGNPVTSYSGPSMATATLSPTSTASNFPTTLSIGTNGQGFTLATLQKVGTYTITVTSGAFSGSAPPVSVTPAPPSQLAFTVQPVTTPTGQPLPGVTVQVLDPYGNLAVSDNSDTITMGVASGPGVFWAASTTTAAVHNGVANFTNLELVVPGSYTLSALVPGRYITNSASFTVLPLQVTSFTSSTSGFSLAFNTSFLVNSTTPVLYGQGFGSKAPPPSVTLQQIKDAGGNPITPVSVEGSVVVNPTNNAITFVATNTGLKVNLGTPILPDGSYSVDLTSTAANDGFQALNAGGGFLDGLGTGTAGSGDYKTTFVINAAATHKDVLWLPSVAEGPGQNLNAPGMNQVGGGYPLYLTDGNGVTSVQVTLSYNPSLLTITAVTGAHFSLSGPPGNVVLTYSGPALASTPNTPVTVGFLTARVPNGTTGNPMPYKAKDLLHLATPSLNGGAIAVATSDALHLVAYVGDADGNGAYSSNDAVLITRAALQTDTGFASYPLVDPVIVADTDGAGFIPADAPLQANEAGVGFATANLSIPPIPSSVVFQPIPNSVDPELSIPADLHVAADGTLTVPVNIDDAHPAGSTGLLRGHLALTYDPGVFTVSAADVHPGSLLAGGDWSIIPTIDPSTGQIGIALSSDSPITNTLGGSLVTIALHLRAGEPGALATGGDSQATIALVSSVTSNGQYFSTELEDAQGTFTLTPAPSNDFNVRTAGLVELQTPPLELSASSTATAVSIRNDDVDNNSGTKAATPTITAAEPAAVPSFLDQGSQATNADTKVSHAGFVDVDAHALIVAPVVSAAGMASAVAVQVSGMVLFNVPIAAGQHLTDQLLQPPGRDANIASSQIAVATLKEAIARVLSSQWRQSDIGDDFGLLSDDVAASDLSWHPELASRGHGDDCYHRNETSRPAINAAIPAIENRTESQTADDMDDLWYDAAEIID